MKLEIFEDNLTKEDLSDVFNHSARAIIMKNNQILFLFAKKMTLYMLPGGRIEKGETPEDCVVREVLEETGYHVNVVKKTVVIDEHYRHSNWNTHYFLCELTDKKQQEVQFTDEEKELDLEMVWLDVSKALTLLDQQDTSFSHGYNIMQREFLALTNSL